MPDQSSEKDLRLAVLIDADNASRGYGYRRQ